LIVKKFRYEILIKFEGNRKTKKGTNEKEGRKKMTRPLSITMDEC
jgi:hypothetical protein